MYFTRYVTQASIRDVGTLLRESPFIVFLRLGDLRRQLSAVAAQALEIRMEMLASPVVDCDKTEAQWEDIREVFEHLGLIVEDLEDDRPFFVAFESERLRDAEASLVPCRVAYVDQAGEGCAEPLDVSEACLAAFGEIYAWILSAERRASKNARRQAIVDLLGSLFERVNPAAEKFGVIESPRQSSFLSAPDLILQVQVTQDRGKAALTYSLYDVTGNAGFHFQTIRGPVLEGSPDAFAASLFEKIEKLHEGNDVDGGRLLLEEAEKELADLGQWLYRTLFPPEMRAAYRRFRGVVRTLQITSDEPWIPWEMIKPFDNEAMPSFEDDFLCARFQLTRWLAGEQSPAPAFQVNRLAVVGAEKARNGKPLPNAMKEREVLTSLAGRHSGVDLASLPDATFDELKELLRKDGPGLLHFVGHGDVAAERSNEAKILLKDRPFRAYNLSAELQAAIRKVRPLVFFNACRVARQGWSLSGLGGWAEAWVRTCGCGAFLGPQWVVKDSLALEFARVFYESLEADKTFGEAVTAARMAVREKDPGRPTWLAYATYGHPGARLVFRPGAGIAVEDRGRVEVEKAAAEWPPIVRPRPIVFNAPAAPEIFLGRGRDVATSPPVEVLAAVRGWPCLGETNDISAIDLDIKVSVRTIDGSRVLHYTLRSPSGAAPLTHREAQTAPFAGSFDAYRDRVFRRLEKLQEHRDPYGSFLLNKEIEAEIRNLGHGLYRQLFPAEMKWMYRQWRDTVRTIQISSAEWWVPWELIRPYDREIQPVVDDDFLGARYQITRWLIGGSAPAPAIRVLRMACVEAGQSGSPHLPSAARERELLTDLARRRNLEDVSPALPTFPEVMNLFERKGLDLLHFVGHGEFSRENAEDSRILLADARSLVAGEMDGPLLRNIADARPLVYFNACSTAQQGASLTSLSGWPDAWVGRGGAGAFIAPQWQVRDSLAFEFARIFYLALERGRTLGRAARLARLWVRRKDRRNVTWLAFAVYGHPNAQVSFGSKPARPFPPPARPERAAPGGGRPAPEIFQGKRTDGYRAPTAIASRLPLPPPSFLGRDDDVRFLKERLRHSSNARADRGPLLLMIGWPGVGKTTMTTALANDPELYEAFPDGILWTSLDQSPNVLIELSSWCIALGSPGPSPGATVDEASLQLGHLLRNRRVLLLLDDVWEVAHATPFLVGGPGCSMLATSRLDQVAEQLARTSGAVYRLPLLTEEAGLELLRSRAPEVVAAYAEECRVLVRELEGLPLSLHVAGRMLAQENRLWSPAELLETLRAGLQLLKETAPSDRTDLSTQTLPTLSVLLAKSTERLPPELLERFAFLGVFAPKPATFDLAALRAVWDVEDPKPSVRALVNLGLLEPAGEGRFRMHALLIAHAKSLLEE